MKKILTDEEIQEAIGLYDRKNHVLNARLIEAMVLGKLRTQAFGMSVLRLSTNEVLEKLFLENV